MIGLPNLSRLVEQATPGPMSSGASLRAADDALTAAAPAMAQLLLACEEALRDCTLWIESCLFIGVFTGRVDRGAETRISLNRAALARLADFDREISP